MKRLADKTALVTGSSSGIGAGIAVRLAQEGAAVAINYRKDRDGAEKTLTEVEAAGGRGIILEGDVSKVADVERLVSETVAQLGRLDVLVNNAGIEKKQAFVEVDEASYDRVLDVNLKAVFFPGVRSRGHPAWRWWQGNQYFVGPRRIAFPGICELLRE